MTCIHVRYVDSEIPCTIHLYVHIHLHVYVHTVTHHVGNLPIHTRSEMRGVS